MSYTPTTDFIGLLRQVSGGTVSQERMPGLDYVVAALARAGLFNISISQTAPTSNQTTTAWFKTALPSWSAEGTLYLWNAIASAYQPATPALWLAFFVPFVSGYSFQSVAAPSGIITPGVSLLAIQRSGPTATALTLPSLGSQAAKKLQIADYSTAVTGHTITLTTPDGATIMQQASWQLLSTASQFASVMLQPSVDLNSWVIAP